MKKKLAYLIGILSLNYSIAFAQIPKPALVGYWQSWSKNLKLTDINSNYNVIQLAFASTVGSTLANMTFSLPSTYNKTTFMADIDAVHVNGKKVILSIGGSSDPVRLDNTTDRDQFIATIDTILSTYNYKMDGIDLDLETTSMDFGSAWTMAAPAAGQINMIYAVKAIMANYQAKTGKKLLLTMAPETVYLMGAMSSYQINYTNGGAMLPIIAGLMNELDLLQSQYYNAGGLSGGTYAIDGKVYYDNSDPNYITSMTESIIKGFTLLNSKGTFAGVPAAKVAIGLPACANGSGTGYNTPANVAQAVQYIRGSISKPTGWTYNMTDAYPDLGGLMTWSINSDLNSSCGGINTFANNFPIAFELTTAGVNDAKIAINQTSFYPNPVTDILHVSNVNSDAEVTVYNVVGKEVLSAHLTDDNTINLSALNAGVYVVEIKNNTGGTREKVIKK